MQNNGQKQVELANVAIGHCSWAGSLISLESKSQRNRTEAQKHFMMLIYSKKGAKRSSFRTWVAVCPPKDRRSKLSDYVIAFELCGAITIFGRRAAGIEPGALRYNKVNR